MHILFTQTYSAQESFTCEKQDLNGGEVQKFSISNESVKIQSTIILYITVISVSTNTWDQSFIIDNKNNSTLVNYFILTQLFPPPSIGTK